MVISGTDMLTTIGTIGPVRFLPSYYAAHGRRDLDPAACTSSSRRGLPGGWIPAGSR